MMASNKTGATKIRRGWQQTDRDEFSKKTTFELTLAGPKQGMSNTFTPNNSTTTQLEKMGLSPLNSSFQALSDGVAGSKSMFSRFWTSPCGF